VCISAERNYAGAVNAPAAARAFGHSAVIASLQPGGWPVGDDVALVISELVTAAVDSEATSVRVVVTVHFDHLIIDIADDRRAVVPAGRSSVSDAADARRTILHTLTPDLRFNQDDVGRTYIQARIPCDPRYTAKVSCRYRPQDRASTS
jgi:hypothetical protein